MSGPALLACAEPLEGAASPGKGVAELERAKAVLHPERGSSDEEKWQAVEPLLRAMEIEEPKHRGKPDKTVRALIDVMNGLSKNQKEAAKKYGTSENTMTAYKKKLPKVKAQSVADLDESMEGEREEPQMEGLLEPQTSAAAADGTSRDERAEAALLAAKAAFGASDHAATLKCMRELAEVLPLKRKHVKKDDSKHTASNRVEKASANCCWAAIALLAEPGKHATSMEALEVMRPRIEEALRALGEPSEGASHGGDRTIRDRKTSIEKLVERRRAAGTQASSPLLAEGADPGDGLGEVQAALDSFDEGVAEMDLFSESWMQQFSDCPARETGPYGPDAPDAHTWAAPDAFSPAAPLPGSLDAAPGSPADLKLEGSAEDFVLKIEDLSLLLSAPTPASPEWPSLEDFSECQPCRRPTAEPAAPATPPAGGSEGRSDDLAAGDLATGEESDPSAAAFAPFPFEGRSFPKLAAPRARCARAGCPCPSSFNGHEGEFCCKTCRAGTPCTSPIHEQPSVVGAPCVRKDCPCTMSYNGQWGEYCCSTCREKGPCKENCHKVISQSPKKKGRPGA